MSKTTKTIISLLVIVMLALVLANLTTYYLIASIPIEGSSMEPTILDKDRAIVYRRAKIEHGDIIIFFSPNDNKYLVKRIIGLEGDVIEIRYDNGANYVFRNGNKLEEPYIKENMNYTHSEILINANEFYYLGDNRNASSDSHYGYLGNMDEVVGQVFLRINFGKFEFEFLG